MGWVNGPKVGPPEAKVVRTDRTGPLPGHSERSANSNCVIPSGGPKARGCPRSGQMRNRERPDRERRPDARQQPITRRRGARDRGPRPDETEPKVCVLCSLVAWAEFSAPSLPPAFDQLCNSIRRGRREVRGRGTAFPSFCALSVPRDLCECCFGVVDGEGLCTASSTSIGRITIPRLAALARNDPGALRARNHERMLPTDSPLGVS